MADNAENVDTSTIGNVNSVRADLTQQEYLFKLVPDFGVFDIAEKYFIDGNLSDGEQQLFFYKRKTVENETIGTTFRRAIFKFDKDISIEEKSKKGFFLKIIPSGENYRRKNEIKKNFIVKREILCYAST